MTTVPFDTLSLAKRLSQAGFTNEQAEGATHALADAFNGAVATKSDVTEVKHEIALLKAEIRDIEQRMTIKLGGMLAVAVGVVAVLVKVL